LLNVFDAFAKEILISSTLLNGFDNWYFHREYFSLKRDQITAKDTEMVLLHAVQFKSVQLTSIQRITSCFLIHIVVISLGKFGHRTPFGVTLYWHPFHKCFVTIDNKNQKHPEI
jgi:hypothetical protein